MLCFSNLGGRRNLFFSLTELGFEPAVLEGGFAMSKRTAKKKSRTKAPMEPISGKDVFSFEDGGKYDGEWTVFEGVKKRHGQGVFEVGGERFDGQWCEDKFTGHGVASFPSGDRFEGSFVDGAFHGEGTYKWADGRVYKGGFVQNRLHGEGCFTLASGETFQGRFHNNRFQDGESHWTPVAFVSR